MVKYKEMLHGYSKNLFIMRDIENFLKYFLFLWKNVKFSSFFLMKILPFSQKGLKILVTSPPISSNLTP